MAKKDASSPQSKAATIIGTGVKVKGNLVSEGNIMIDGQMNGNIKSGGDIELGVNAKVTGDLIGANVVVAGVLTGNITASNQMLISATGEVTGDITATALEIENGAYFLGNSKMKRDAKTETTE